MTTSRSLRFHTIKKIDCGGTQREEGEGREKEGKRGEGRKRGRKKRGKENTARILKNFPCPSCSAASLEPPYGRLISIETGTVNHFPENTAGTYYWNNFL